MNPDPNKRRLLADILAEDSDPALKGALFEETLRLVRRQKRVRVIGRIGSGVAVVALSALLAFHYPVPWPLSHRINAPPSGSGCALIRTQPLDPSLVVTTQPLLLTAVVTSGPASEIVTTGAARPLIPELTDDQLLDLARGAPVALVRLAPHQADLVFINDDDREKLFRN